MTRICRLSSSPRSSPARQRAGADPAARSHRRPAAIVHLGDLFADAGSRADDPVAPAPPPGTRITYGADWLGRGRARARPRLAAELALRPGHDRAREPHHRHRRGRGSKCCTRSPRASPSATPSSQLDNPGLAPRRPGERRADDDRHRRAAIDRSQRPRLGLRFGAGRRSRGGAAARHRAARLPRRRCRC